MTFQPVNRPTATGLIPVGGRGSRNRLQQKSLISWKLTVIYNNNYFTETHLASLSLNIIVEIDLIPVFVNRQILNIPPAGDPGRDMSSILLQ